MISALAIGSLLALGACKKDDKKGDDKAADKDKNGDDKGAAKPTDDTAANPCGDDGAKNPCGGGDMSMDDKKAMAEKIVTMFEAVGKAITENEADCAKMAAGVQKIADENKELITKGKALDDDPEFKKWFEETHGEKIKTVMTGAVTSMIKNCKDDEGVKNAFEALTGEG
jgi:hypothetical protein